jgi:predicted RNA polymerase sigma factor
MKGSCVLRQPSARWWGAPLLSRSEAAAGWALLGTLPAEVVKTYQPYWALASHLLQRMGRADEASSAYSRVIGLCEDAAMRDREVAAKASRT